MREIKFRAWDKVNKEMCKITQLLFWEGEKIGIVSVDTERGELQHLPVESFEIMQFTGLQDKNGKDIYEGDIINNECYNFEVKFGEWYCAEVERHYTGFYLVNAEFDDSSLSELVQYDDCEIIGNIHEHKDLLEGE